MAGLAYLIAVTQRTTMGSVAMDAANRFDTSAAQLSSLAVLQLLFYAGMQIPVGILLDRFGSRRLIAVGALLMASGQIVVAFSEVLPAAVLGRILVGIGDACTFISMIRMANTWFEGSKASHLQQWLATIGQSGQILSAIPFAFLLHLTSWQTAFITAASISLFIACLVWLFAKENSSTGVVAVSLSAVFANLRKNAKRPVTWVAFFTHFTTQSTGTTFALLWGVPFMVSALAMNRAEAGGMLTVFTLTNASMGPVIGLYCARLPNFRHRLVLSIVGAILTIWFVVICWPGAVPVWVLLILVMVIGVGGPGSMIAFDYTKENIQAIELGAVNGLVNVGGFLASLAMMWIIGISLDAQGGAVLYSSEHFKVAFGIQLIVTAIGIVGFLVAFRRYRNTRAETLV